MLPAIVIFTMHDLAVMAWLLPILLSISAALANRFRLVCVHSVHDRVVWGASLRASRLSRHTTSQARVTVSCTVTRRQLVRDCCPMSRPLSPWRRQSQRLPGCQVLGRVVSDHCWLWVTDRSVHGKENAPEPRCRQTFAPTAVAPLQVWCRTGVAT